MTKGVSAKTFTLKTCLLHCQLYIELYAAGVHALTLFGSFKQIGDRPVLAEIFPKRCQCKGRQQGVTVFIAFIKNQ